MSTRVPKELKNFGNKLKRFLASKKMYDILGEEGGTWTAGGCWILAEALHSWLGPGSELVAVGSSVNKVEHVAVRVEDGYFYYYLDGDGFQTEEEFLRKMRELERISDPFIHQFDPRDVTEIPCPLISVKRVVEALTKRFGKGS